MSNRRHGRIEMLEGRLTELIKAGGSADEMKAIQSEIDELETHTRRRDCSDDLAIAQSSEAAPGDSTDGWTIKTSHEKGMGIVRMFRAMLADIAKAPSPRFACECCQIALGFKVDIERVSMRDVARRNGKTPEAVSKRVDELRREFNLPTTDQNKSDRAVERYKSSNGRMRKKL